MLTQVTDPQDVLARLAGDPIRGFVMRNFCRTPGESGTGAKVLVDDPREPVVVVAHAATSFHIMGSLPRLRHALADLLAGRVEQDGGWPDQDMQRDWDEHGGGHRGLFLNSCHYAIWRAALEEGFEPHPEDSGRHVAYLWHWRGAPRLSRLVQHECRVTEGQELFELMRQGVEYDPEGEYVRLCLEHGPSFVCVVPGADGGTKPVCWSCTHLNGTMGMIYTPDEFRRQGYARSLAAFQIDYMLARDGIACCHIIDHNVASMNLVAELGAQWLPEPLVWRVVYWPGEAPPPKEPEAETPAADEE
jgi:hypothetical protein